MCTCILVGRKASATGKVIFGANDDWDGVSGLLTHRKRSSHLPGAMYTLTGGQKIPQPSETNGYSYTACRYSIGNLDRGWAGGMNDRGVAVAGTGVFAYKPIEWQGKDFGLEPDDVPLLILQRAQTARQGVRMIGDMIDEMGMRPSVLDGCQSGATFSVADENEGWVLEFTPGKYWVAVRVPDDAATVRANAFGSRHIDLYDTENVMSSPDLAEFAERNGWWTGDKHDFDFAAAYGSETSPDPFWGPERDPMNFRRRWRAAELLSGKTSSETEPIYTVHPDHLLTRTDMMSFLEDVYESTPYDLTMTEAAGQYADPFTEDAPDYSLCRRGTVSSIVSDFNGENSVLWTALVTPRMSFYIPIFADIDALSECCENCEPDVPDAPSLFWENKELSFLVQRAYNRRIGVVKDAKNRYDADCADALRECREKLTSLSTEERRAVRTAFTAARIECERRLCRETKTKLKLLY